MQRGANILRLRVHRQWVGDREESGAGLLALCGQVCGYRGWECWSR